MSSTAPSDFTRQLRAAARGDRSAMDELMPVLYGELRSRASHYLQKERAGHTLQTTALVHEAYLRLVNQGEVEWRDRVHFFASAAQCIRRILVDHARRRQTAKRSPQFLVQTDEIEADTSAKFLVLDEALEQLALHDERKARVVELRFFAGLENTEIAEALGISKGSVERDVRLAKAWLHRFLNSEAES